MARRLVHVDINSYFATVLQQENPRLRGRPVAVVKSAGRSCVIAASKEAKLRGVRTGSRLISARARVPELVVVPAEFDVYLDCTRRLKAVFAALAPDVEIFSLDEAFIDLTHCQTLYPDVVAFGKLVQRRIRDELGEWVSCNVGISYTRLLAKLASEVSPKGSVVEITPENRDWYLASAPFESVCGVGQRLERRLARLGVETLYQLNCIAPADLEQVVGSFWAPQLLRMARGEDSPTLRRLDQPPLPHMKSVGRTITGFKPCDDETVIKQTLYNLCEEAAHKVRRMELAGRHVGVLLSGSSPRASGSWSGVGARTGSEGSWYRHQMLPHHICHTRDLFQVAYHQLYRSWQRSFRVIRYGVFLSELQPLSQVPIQLFEDFERKDRVARAVDQLNHRYGLFTVRPATLTQAVLIRPEVTGFLGDKQFHGL